LLENPLKADRSIPDAVVIVPFHTTRNKLVVIKEFRVALGDDQYGFPAGLVDDGESIEQAAQRELREETGLRIDQIIRTSPVVYSSSGLTDESICLVFADCSGRPTTAYNEASEDIEVLFFSRRDIRQLLNRSDIKFDIKTWLAMDGFTRQEKR
jgi:ADP-ribose pyrophosphatase